MSACTGIKRQILEARKLGNPHYSSSPADRPRTQLIRAELRKEAATEAGFQCFPGNENKDKKNGALSITEKILAPGGGGEEDRMEIFEEKEEVKTAWRGPNLDSASEVKDLSQVIKSIKQPGILFDGGKTKIGKKSQLNLFQWIEEYSRLEHKMQKEADNRALL